MEVIRKELPDHSAIGAFRELFAARTGRERLLLGAEICGVLAVMGFLCLFLCVCFPIFVITSMSSIVVTLTRMTITLSLHHSAEWRRRMSRRLCLRFGCPQVESRTRSSFSRTGASADFQQTLKT